MFRDNRPSPIPWARLMLCALLLQAATATKSVAQDAACDSSIPTVVGSAPAGAPSAKLVADSLRGSLREAHAPIWMRSGDVPSKVCVTFGPLHYFPATMRKMLPGYYSELATYPVKTEITISYRQSDGQMKVIEKGRGKETFFFYQDEENKGWGFKSGEL